MTLGGKGLRSSSSFLRLLPHLPVTSNYSFYLSLNNLSQKTVFTQCVYVVQIHKRVRFGSILTAVVANRIMFHAITSG
jgi:hypothetical protein